MDNKNIAERLRGFEDVWARVVGAKPAGAPPAGMRLMPRKNSKPRPQRHKPGGR